VTSPSTHAIPPAPAPAPAPAPNLAWLLPGLGVGSPHMMLGALLKRVTHDVWGGHAPEDMYLVSVMPCVRKKGESDRPEFTVGRALYTSPLVTSTRVVVSLIDINGGYAQLTPRRYSSEGGAGMMGTWSPYNGQGCTAAGPWRRGACGTWTRW
jgi:iron only hydrogenase large subunit-like protein